MKILVTGGAGFIGSAVIGISANSEPKPKKLVTAIFQCGDTVDKLVAMCNAKSMVQKEKSAIGNMLESTSVREYVLRLSTRAVSAISGATTKALSNKHTVLYLFTLAMAKAKQKLKTELESSLSG